MMIAYITDAEHMADNVLKFAARQVGVRQVVS